MADWLNGTFAGLDGGMFRAMNGLAKGAGSIFTPLFKVLTLLGEKGIIFFAAAIVLMLFPKTRRAGVCIFGAVACGALITNIILKDNVMRERPFLANGEYFSFWEYIGKPSEDGYSFPSGHVTAISAFAMAMLLSFNKKWSWTGFVGVLFMGMARVYLVAHYTTDVIAGVIVGVASGALAYFIAKWIFKTLGKYSDKKFCKFCLEFDVRNLFKKKTAFKEENSAEGATSENAESTEEK